jgi:hypothetical protein
MIQSRPPARPIPDESTATTPPPAETRGVSAPLRRKGDIEPPLAPLFEVNERCLLLLTETARSETRPASALVIALRRPLLAMTPDIRARASRRPILLLDMAFRDALWWRDARSHPRRTTRTTVDHEAFPAPSARALARASLVLAWHSVRADPIASGVILGISRPVAEILGGLALSDLDSIAERRFRSLRPRWEDRPALWRKLLHSGQSTDFRRGKEFTLRSLQLLSFELLHSEEEPAPLNHRDFSASPRS